ncbi:unnamed protein product [Hymenolepis diminuta]|uniref:Uncharacterized protein n=1 Tax=Hymenolepis diminuta TaxID=6216 RepID=A0A564YT63_HYMDI|nr:unnamed protein product [Hymenolepis diminuta]VUZ42758.1 unnamed protein product [Hymenolepis diminuta]VUZ48455.1 unnamed protein product [Hymenolepis diminuta]VUZ50457.1 unnamed protein product [Hymenolepis diminuta]
MEQMNLSKPDRNPEDCIKNVGEFHDEPSVGEIFTTCRSDHDLYLVYPLPLSPKDLTFEETIEKREKVFDDNRHFICLNLAIHEGKDIHKYEIVGLRSPCYAGISLKLSLLDKNPDIKLHHLLDAYNNFRSLITDSNMIESNETRARQIKKRETDRSTENKPSS